MKGRSEEDKAQETKRYEKQRGTASQRGYTTTWRRARKIYLTNNFFCAECKRHGIARLATIVDHIIPHRGDEKLMWDEDNWQPLCDTCHNRKTARQDGGFGNRP